MVITSRVIRSQTFWFRSLAKRTSRLVRMPTRRCGGLPSPSTTGIPLIWCAFISSSASPSVRSGVMVSGFTTMPDSYFFTRLISAACDSMLIFLWMTPMPPAWAMAMASLCSVTVSIAAETSGMFREIDLVSLVATLVSAGNTAERDGSRSTSSNVRASRIFMRAPSACPVARHYILGLRRMTAPK